MPTILAASTMSVPAGTVTLCPSMVRLTSGMDSYFSDVAGVSKRMVFVFLAEMPERRIDHPSSGITQPAQTAPVLEPVCNTLQDAELDLRSLVGEDSFIGPYRPVAPDAAGRAFATGLVRVELEES